MKILHSVADLRQVISEYKLQGRTISLVPTMGHLHEGHLQLVDKALQGSSLNRTAHLEHTHPDNTKHGNKKHSKNIVITSVFVNPLQFNQQDDLEKYPRTLDADAEKLQARDCDILFAPAVEEVYPDSQNNGHDQTLVNVPGISEMLEGASRPGHFNGVATIVCKLFNLVQPDQAVFGEKDYQQLQIIRQMVNDLCFPIKILAVETVREANGLAMSSRNSLLSEDQRKRAGLIYETLQQTAAKILAGETDFSLLEETAVRNLNQQGFATDYISIRTRNIQPASTADKALVILAAARLGTTRLIDNLQLQRYS